MTRLMTVSILCLAGAFQPVFGQNFLPPTELAIDAIAKQAEVLAADERVSAVDAQARALAIGSYELSATVIPQRRRTNTGQSLDEFEVELGRSFRLPGKVPLDREIGERSRNIASLERNEIAHEAAHQLLDRWMQWLRATAAAEESKAQLQSLQTERTSLARRVEIGDAAQLDLDLITAELAQARATALHAEALVTAAKHALNTDFPQIPLPARAPALPEPHPLAGTSDEWQTRIASEAYELKSAEHAAARQDASAKRATADRIPDPSLGVRFFNERDGQERAVGLVFTMPLAGRYRRELASAERAQARALQRDVEVVKRGLAKSAYLKVAFATDALRQWQAQHEAHVAMRAAATRTYRAWELGETGLAERLLAARRAREMTYQELEARAEALDAQLRVRIDSHDLWHIGSEEGEKQ
ncbi:MAG: TolC family protein [Pseudomonadota bacterium]|nr:TolC family protein [Pseudomonadota bacterium]